MPRSILIFALGAAFCLPAIAKSFQGRLIDAACYDQQKSANTCDPTNGSSRFALVVSNQLYKLDAQSSTGD